MGEEADWLMDHAMGLGHRDFDEDGEYDPQPRRRRRNILNKRYWVDGKDRTLYPEKPPHAGGMTLAHIQAVKKHLLETYHKGTIENTPLWQALCTGERMHEGELQKTKDLNKGVIHW